MATLIDSAEFTTNEVYEIQSTDPVEGAATGASYGGIGVSNQPHQQLANRTAFLKQRQDINVANIATLQAFEAMFSGLMGPNGYLKVGVNDSARGSIAYVVQWGQYSIGTDLAGDTAYSISWPVAFPNTCVWAGGFPANPAGLTKYGNCIVETVNLGVAQGTFMVDWNGNAGGSSKMPGFYWIAIGF